MTWLGLRNKLALITRERPRSKGARGLRSRRKRLEPRPRNRSAPGRERGSNQGRARGSRQGRARSRVAAEQEVRVDCENEIANFQEIGNEQLKSATTSPTFLVTGFQSITAETIEYSKKSLENGSAFVGKLLGAKSFQSAIQVRSEYAKTSYAAQPSPHSELIERDSEVLHAAFCGLLSARVMDCLPRGDKSGVSAHAI